jgi:hypothetical protein
LKEDSKQIEHEKKNKKETKSIEKLKNKKIYERGNEEEMCSIF